MSAIDLTGESARTYQYESSGRFRPDDADRRALGVGAHDAERAGGDPDIDAAGDRRLHRFAAAAGEQEIEVEIVLAEDAGALAQCRRSTVPYLALADSDRELVRRRYRCRHQPCHGNERKHEPGGMQHGASPSLASHVGNVRDVNASLRLRCRA